MNSELPTMKEKLRRAEGLARITGGSCVNPDAIFFNGGAERILDSMLNLAERLDVPCAPYNPPAGTAYSTA